MYQEHTAQGRYHETLRNSASYDRRQVRTTRLRL